MPPAEPEVVAKPKRKPREPKKSKVIAVDVNPTEYFDDQAPPPPSPEEKVEAKPKAKPRGRAKAKPVAEPVAELVAEPVVEPVIEQVVAPVKTKRVRKPRQFKVEPEPVPDPPPPPIVDIEDLEDQVAKRMKALRDAREIKKKERIQALIAQAI